MSKKEGVKIPAVEESNTPVKNFLFLLLLVPIAPLILAYSLITGRLQNPFIVGACLALMIGIGGYYSFNKYFGTAPVNLRKEKLSKMTDELSSEDRETLRKEFSTLRESIGAEKLPSQLEPMLDIKMNMLNINYFYFLLNTGHIGKNAEGTIYILQNALYSGDYKVTSAAWKSLHLINTPSSKQIIDEFLADLEKTSAKKSKKKKKGMLSKDYRRREDSELFKDDINNSLKGLRFKFDSFGF